ECNKLLDKAATLLESLAVSDPADLKTQFSLASALVLRGTIYTQAGQWKEGQAQYERALAVYRRLVEINSADYGYQRDLAFAEKHLGSNLIMQKQLQPALELYRAALTIDEAQLNADPQNASRRYNITFSYSDIGFILGHQGNIDGALGYYRKALAIRKA